MKSSKSALAQRGFVTEKEITDSSHLNSNQLMKMLQSKSPQDRTIASTLLGQKSDTTAIVPLCEALKTEKKLYSKIAISEALGSFGKDAVKKLTPLLGKIGNNQYRKLPAKPFNKTNYPLPRDIIARTITKVGVEALPFLMEILQKGLEEQISEAIDAIGYISYYSNDNSSLNSLWDCLENYKNNQIIVWKIIWSFQAFPDKKVISFLHDIKLSSESQQIRWEAERSLIQIESSSKK